MPAKTQKTQKSQKTQNALRVSVQSMELNTSGEFTVKKVDGSSHLRCGPMDSPRRFDFSVLVEASPKDLDARGFLVDWQDVHAYFRNTFEHIKGDFPSCEGIAQIACKGLVEMMQGHCDACHVTVGFAGGTSNMTASYIREEETSLEAQLMDLLTRWVKDNKVQGSTLQAARVVARELQEAQWLEAARER